MYGFIRIIIIAENIITNSNTIVDNVLITFANDFDVSLTFDRYNYTVNRACVQRWPEQYKCILVY